MYHAHDEKRKTTNVRRNRTTKSKKKSERSEKKEAYKIGIFEADTIKHAKMKEKL